MTDSAQADAYVHAVARDWRSAALSEEDAALCGFAVKLTHDAKAMNADDLDSLRAHGFDDRAIHDTTQVVALFNYFTRLADGLGVEPEGFIEPWGQS